MKEEKPDAVMKAAKKIILWEDRLKKLEPKKTAAKSDLLELQAASLSGKKNEKGVAAAQTILQDHEEKISACKNEIEKLKMMMEQTISYRLDATVKNEKTTVDELNIEFLEGCTAMGEALAAAKFYDESFFKSNDSFVDLNFKKALFGYPAEQSKGERIARGAFAEELGRLRALPSSEITYHQRRQGVMMDRMATEKPDMRKNHIHKTINRALSEVRKGLSAE